MCLIGLHINDHPTYKLIIIANRDEFFERPTKAARFWEQNPSILAGQDLVEGGTWLGVTRSGKFAALTNFRKLEDHDDRKTSRGEIVVNFLKKDIKAYDYLHGLRDQKDKYNGYNTILGHVDDLYYYGNYQEDIIKLSQGTHGLSNHLLNTNWPKVKQIKSALNDYVSQHNQLSVDHLFKILNTADIADDTLLPHTGVGLQLERQLSPIFIQTDNYGTRCSTVLLVTHDNNLHFHERTYTHKNEISDLSYSFVIEA